MITVIILILVLAIIAGNFLKEKKKPVVKANPKNNKSNANTASNVKKANTILTDPKKADKPGDF